MRADVKQPLYKLRKYIEEALYHYLPSLGWQTQYTRVSFTNQRYSEIIKVNRRQGRILGLVFGSTLISTLAVAGILYWKQPPRSPGFAPVAWLRAVSRGILSRFKA
jgi:kynurenine 3-monooxygenase